MSIKNLINSNEWPEVEYLLRDKMTALAFDIDMSKSTAEIGLTALANKKAYDLLDKFLKEVGIFKGDDSVIKKRDFK